MKDNTELIARYLQGKLSPEEREKMEADLQTDEALQAELAFFQEAQMLSAMEAYETVKKSPELAEYKQAFQEILEDEDSNEPAPEQEETPIEHQAAQAAISKRIGHGWWMIIALLLIIAAAFLYFNIKPKSKPIALTYGETQTGHLNKPGEIHTFLFIGKTEDTVTISVQSAGLNPVVSLYDSTKKLIPSTLLEVNDTLSTAKVVLPMAGKFILEISAQPDDRAKSYLLRLEKATRPVAVNEPAVNNTLTSDPMEPENAIENQNSQEQEQPSSPLLALATDYLNAHFADDFETGGIMGEQEDEIQDTLAIVSKAFDDQNWKRATTLYEQIDSLWDYEEEYAKLGMAYLKDQRPTKAIDIFRFLSESSFLPEWRSRGQWYLALSYLMSGEKYQKDFEAVLNEALKNSDMDEKMKNRFRELDVAYREQQ